LTSPADTIDELDSLIRRDPARRGLISTEAQFGPLCAGHLAAAAADLHARGRRVALVTGFYVPHAQPPSAETDGPPGALLLALVLERLGMASTILTDGRCLAAVRAAASACDYPREQILEFPREEGDWIEAFYTTGPGRSLTHLIAVERVGPSHTVASLRLQARAGAAPIARFEAVVPEAHRNRCHNMRGVDIEEYTAPMHRLFEELERYHPGAATIGIGDGANEIGMGSIPWEELARRLDGEFSARIPCRIATRWNIIAGTSNWGASALAAALLVCRGEAEVLRPLDRRQQQHVLEQMVQHGPAVDGMTGRQEATVDGLPFLTYIQPWEGIRRLLGLGG